MLRSTAVVATDAPARYAKQLLAHVGRHNVVEPLDGDPDGGRLVFPDGVGTLRCGDGTLTLIAEAPDADGLAHVTDVLARHLERFGAKRDLAVTWDRDG